MLTTRVLMWALLALAPAAAAGAKPTTLKPVNVATRPSDRALQRALLQFFLPEDYFDVKKALKLAGREDLIGDGPECLIAAQPSRAVGNARAAAEARCEGASEQTPNADRGKPAGYRWAARKRRRR